MSDDDTIRQRIAGKSVRAVTSDFNRAVINEFGGSSKAISSKFRVLTACSYTQLSTELLLKTNYAFGVFTQVLYESVYSGPTNRVFVEGYLPYIVDKTKTVKLKDLYTTTRLYVNDVIQMLRAEDPSSSVSNSDVQVFPQNSSFVMFDFR